MPLNAYPFQPRIPAVIGKKSYSRRCALLYGENCYRIFFLEEKIWRFENFNVTYHIMINPQLLVDFLVNVLFSQKKESSLYIRRVQNTITFQRIVFFANSLYF